MPHAKVSKPLKKKPVPNAAKKRKEEPQLRSLPRKRTQAVPFQLVDAATIKPAKRRKIGKASVKKIEGNKKKTKTLKPKPKTSKAAGIRKNGKVIAKVRTGKVTKKKIAKEPKVKAKAKKGNDKLNPRTGVPQYDENPFLDKPVEDEISNKSFHRVVVRHILKKNAKALEAVFKGNKINRTNLQQCFSHDIELSPESAIGLSGDMKLIEKFFKLKSQLNNTKFVGNEMNLLQQKQTGKSSYYMIGRHTRGVEMTRGGKEGNNAFLKYEGKIKRLNNVSDELLEHNVPHDVLQKLSKISGSAINSHSLSSGVVRAARMGHISLASKLAEAEAKDNFNDLHRFTLKGGDMPARILPVSLAKKGFNNANITPIHTAAINDDIKILKRLSEIDPNINIPDKDNWYTTHYAAVSESSDVLQYLLNHTGAPINLFTKSLESPLHCAARAGRLDNVKILLEQIKKNEVDIKAEKSLVNMRNRAGDTPLMLAIRYNRVDVVEALLSHPSIVPDIPASVGQMKRTALMLACALGFKPIVKMLVEKNCLVEGKDQKKRTPLIHACLNGQTHIVAYLLQLGADLKAIDSSANSAAHYAAAYGFTDCVTLLADIDPTILSMENDWKISPFSVAYLKGHYRLVSVLLNGKYKAYVDINGKDSDGVTLLSSILRYSSDTSGDLLYDQLNFLISKGADCGLPDGRGNTPSHDFVNLKLPVISAENSFSNSLTGYKKCCELLLKNGASLSTRNDKGVTPFHMICENGNFHLLSWLLDTFDLDSNVFFQNWAEDRGFLHDLLKAPIVAFQKHMKNLNYSFDPACYDVVHIIQLLSKKFGSDFDVQKELNKVNKDGLTPLMEMMNCLKNGSWAASPNVTSSALEQFTDFVFLQVLGIIRIDRSVLMKQFEIEKENSVNSVKTSILAVALSIKFNDNFKLLQKIIADSKSYLKNLNPWSIQIGEKPILIAAIETNEKAVKILLDNLEYGEDDKCFLELYDFPDTNDPKVKIQKNALMLMVEHGMLNEVLQLPLTTEALSPSDSDGNNLAHYIASRNHPQSVELLQKLRAKKFFNKNKNGETPLHKAVIACTSGKSSLLDTLEYFSANIPVDIVDDEGRTALHYAFGTRESFDDISLLVKRDPIAIISILTAKSTPELMNKKDTYGNTALHLAAYCDSNVCAVSLLRKGALINDENEDGNTPLGIAVSRGNKTVALALLQANADVHRKVLLEDPDEDKDTCWLWKGDLDDKKESETQSSIIREVIKREKDWESMVYVMIDVIGNDSNAFNQLVECCLQFKQYTLANQLLKSIELRSGNETFEDKLRLFQQFARYHPGNLKKGEIDDIVFDRLLRIGAVLLEDNVCTPIELALRKGNFSLYKRIKEVIGEKQFSLLKPSSLYGGPLKEIIHALSKQHISWEGKHILQQVLQINKISRDDSLSLPLMKHLKSESIDGPFTALEWACLHDFKDLVALLREMDFDCNVVDIYGRTPIMMIALANSQSAFEALYCEKYEKPTIVKKQITANRNTIFTIRHSAKAEDPNAEFASNAYGSEYEENSDDGTSSNSGSHSNNSDEEPEDNNNSEQTYTVKINNKKFSLSAKDENGKSVFHYFVEPFAWENVDFLKTLVDHFGKNAKTLLAEADKDGNTPSEICRKTLQIKMYKAIQKHLSSTVQKILIPLPTVSISCPYNIDELADKYLNEYSENDSIVPVDELKPNELSGYVETGTIVICPETGEPMKALMNKTDIGYGRYGFHNFYRLELIKRKDTELYILFTNWGRIGSGEGEHQITPYGSLEIAVKEFKSVFKSKMGQDWKKLSEIEIIPKRYRLIQKIEKIKTIADIDIPRYTEDVSEKSEEDQFIADVTDVKSLKKYMKQGSSMNQSLPYGRIDKASLQKAKDILSTCAQISKAFLADTEATTITLEEKTYTILEALQQVNDLSSEFYAILRPGTFESSMLPRFDSQHEIKEAFDLIRRLTEIEAATRILVASLSYPNIDRLTFIRQSLSCELKMLAEDDPMSQHILHWISNSSKPHPTVQGIMSILPEKPLGKFAQFVKEDKQMYLFHGTKPTNLISIIENGLQTNPVFARRTGQLFGEGVYLADTFEKSRGYCSPSKREMNYMLVCQVALGDVVEEISTQSTFYRTEFTEFKDSLVVRGIHYPSSSLTVNGVSMPLGQVKIDKKRCMNHSEYIIRDGERVLPRFLILFKN